MIGHRLVLLVTGFCAIAIPTNGEVLRPAVDPTGGFAVTGEWPVPTLIAFQFVPISDGEYARALGVFDRGSNGLNAGRPVGLYDVLTGQQLAAVDVPSGSSTALVDGFRYMPITPVLLRAGRAYQVVTLHNGPGIETLEESPSAISVNLDPGLMRFGSYLELRPPNNELGIAGDRFQLIVFGPNLLIGPVPEPVSATMAGVLAGLLFASSPRHRELELR